MTHPLPPKPPKFRAGSAASEQKSPVHPDPQWLLSAPPSIAAGQATPSLPTACPSRPHKRLLARKAVQRGRADRSSVARALDGGLDRRPAEASAAEECAQQLHAAVRRYTLDCSKFSERLVAQLPAASWAQLAKEIKAEAKATRKTVRVVKFPKGLKDLPTGLEALGRLRVLCLPEFQGTQLDTHRILKGKSSRLKLPQASQLRELHVAQGTKVDCQPAHAFKVTVHRYSARRTRSFAQTLAEHIYYRQPKEFLPKAPEALSGDQEAKIQRQIIEQSFNCQVQRSDGKSRQEISCVDLSTHWVSMRRAYRQLKGAKGAPAPKAITRPPSSEKVRFSYEHFASPEKISQHVPLTIRQSYQQIISRGRDNSLVQLSQWGQFLTEQCKALAPGASRYFLVESTDHCMALELSVQLEPGMTKLSASLPKRYATRSSIANNNTPCLRQETLCTRGST